MGYKIKGTLKGKSFSSKSYKTEGAALKAGYKLVYLKSGSKKRKKGLTNWRIV